MLSLSSACCFPFLERLSPSNPFELVAIMRENPEQSQVGSNPKCGIHDTLEAMTMVMMMMMSYCVWKVGMRFDVIYCVAEESH